MFKLFLVLSSICFFATAQAQEKVFFISPKDNAVVGKTFKVKFGQEGLLVKPAGEEMLNKNAGHFHLIIDGGFVPEGHIVPTDAQHLHFGKAQTETKVTLTPGKHTLTLQFADGGHVSAGPRLSQTITVEVK